jgi:RNA polymerase sigma factor (sigma-70 family)
MARGLSGPTLAGLHGVLEAGSLTGLTEAQLLRRYLAFGDQRAFEVLVSRHAPLVLGVCRRFIRDPHDVEDAFQATFLILVRKAASIREPSRLGPWLFGVAYRVATRSRASAASRKACETATSDLNPRQDTAARDLDDLRFVVDEELNALPEKYRAPIVLCYLEGRSHDEAASQLGWPIGTVRSRLSRARDRLRTRLSRRGYAPLAVLLEREAGPLWPAPETPPALIQAMIETVNRTSMGRSITAATVSRSVEFLSKGVLTMMWMSKIKTAAAFVLAATAIGSGAILYAQSRPGAPGDSGAGDAPSARTGTSSRPADAIVGRGATPGQDLMPEGATRPSPHELSLRLKLALQKLKFREQMYRKAFANIDALEEARIDVEIIRARIVEEQAALEEELELLEARKEAKHVDIQAANVLVKRLEDAAARTMTLVKQGAVSTEAASKTERDVAVEQSRRDQLRAEVRLLEIRIKHVQRRLLQFAKEKPEKPGIQEDPKRGANGTPPAPPQLDPGEVRSGDRGQEPPAKRP